MPVACMFAGDVGSSPEPMGRRDADREPRPGQSIRCRVGEAGTSCHVVRQLKKDLESLNKLDLDLCTSQPQTTTMLTCIGSKRGKKMKRQRCRVRGPLRGTERLTQAARWENGVLENFLVSDPAPR